MDMLNEITFVKKCKKEIKSGGRENKWTEVRAKSHTKRSTVGHRVLVQQDHLLREDQMQRVEPVRIEDKYPRK
jgi:hypothetical protein